MSMLQKNVRSENKPLHHKLLTHSFSHTSLLFSPSLCAHTGLLEDERLASAHQAEAFARQVHNLQGTVCSRCMFFCSRVL